MSLKYVIPQEINTKSQLQNNDANIHSYVSIKMRHHVYKFFHGVALFCSKHK